MNKDERQSHQGGPVSPSQGGLSWSQPVGNIGQFGEKKGEKRNELSGRTDMAVVDTGNLRSPAFIGAFAAGLVVGVLGGWLWFGGIAPAVSEKEIEVPAGPSAATSTRGSTPADVPVISATAELAVPSSQSAGLSVAVTHTTLSAPTWVVVYENRGGELGNALGAALFTPERTSGTVHLLRGTIAGQSYFVGLRQDDGDRIFSLGQDVPVLNQDGDPIVAQFRAQ